jgi:proteic killer suppression protein
LARFFENGDIRGINLLTTLNISTSPSDMEMPGSKLHPLKGERKGFWAVSVSGNWRPIFEFEDEDAANVDLVDYH